MANFIKQSIVVTLLSFAISSIASANEFERVNYLASEIQSSAGQLLNVTEHYRDTPNYKLLVDQSAELQLGASKLVALLSSEADIYQIEAKLAGLDQCFHNLANLFDSTEFEVSQGHGIIHGETAHVKQLLLRIESDIYHLLADVTRVRKIGEQLQGSQQVLTEIEVVSPILAPVSKHGHGPPLNHDFGVQFHSIGGSFGNGFGQFNQQFGQQFNQQRQRDLDQQRRQFDQQRRQQEDQQRRRFEEQRRQADQQRRQFDQQRGEQQRRQAEQQRRQEDQRRQQADQQRRQRDQQRQQADQQRRQAEQQQRQRADQQRRQAEQRRQEDQRRQQQADQQRRQRDQQRHQADQQRRRQAEQQRRQQADQQRRQAEQRRQRESSKRNRGR